MAWLQVSARDRDTEILHPLVLSPNARQNKAFGQVYAESQKLSLSQLCE